MKNVGFRIRIDRELREQFLKVCKGEDKPAAQVLREFMRHYVDEREGRAHLASGPVKKIDEVKR